MMMIVNLYSTLRLYYAISSVRQTSTTGLLGVKITSQVTGVLTQCTNVTDRQTEV